MKPYSYINIYYSIYNNIISYLNMGIYLYTLIKKTWSSWIVWIFAAKAGLPGLKSCWQSAGSVLLHMTIGFIDLCFYKLHLQGDGNFSRRGILKTHYIGENQTPNEFAVHTGNRLFIYMHLSQSGHARVRSETLTCTGLLDRLVWIMNIYV